MSSGQEATCDCQRCVAHRGGTWDEVNGEAVRRVRERQQRAAEIDREIERLRAEREKL